MEHSDFKNPRNPKENSNFLSKLTFLFTLNWFITGFKKDFKLKDLSKPLKIDESGSLGDRLERYWMRQVNTNVKPSLLKAIAITFWREYFLLAVLQLLDIVIRLTQPFLLGLFLKYFSPGSKITIEDAFLYASGLVALGAIVSLTSNHYIIIAFHNGMKVRVATCSVIYRKSLKLSSTALGNTSVGKVINLLTNDVSRFDIASSFIHKLWITPILFVAVGFVLYQSIGLSGIIGMIVILVITPIQSYTGTLASKFRLQIALRTDERVRLMDEIIASIQVIKLYAWEKSFKKLVYYFRDKELKVIFRASYVRAFYMTFMLFTTRSALFCAMLAIITMGDQLTAAKVFTISLYYSLLNGLSMEFVRAIAEVSEALVAVKRLQAFLEYDEKESLTARQKLMNEFGSVGEEVEIENLMNSETQLPPNIALSMKNVSCRWKTVEESLQKPDKKIINKSSKEIPKLSQDPNKFDESDETKLTLNNVSLEVRRGILVGILGHVGSGKSSLLQTILRELPTESGSLAVRGKLSFATQEPWVFSGSVRQNILFGEEMDKDRYEEVVNACALKKDFEMFPFGDQTLIGERGSSLSGGQKARVSLARALYRKADIYLMDDPLSAVDAHVGKHLFEQCISSKGFLGRQRATRILVTHQVHFLKSANWIVVMKDGKIERQGRAEDLENSGVDVLKIAEATEEEFVRRRSLSRSSSKSSTSLNEKSDEDQEEPEEEHEKQTNAEEMSKGKVKGNIAFNYLKSGGNLMKISFAIFLFALTQSIASVSDYWVSFWTRQEELRGLKIKEALNQPDQEPDNSTLVPIINGTSSVIFASAFTNITDQPDNILPSETLIYIGGSLIAALFVIAIARSIFFYTITIGASRNLHHSAFNGIISTKMRFFDLNPSGRILNRFSKDMGQIDEWLPKCILDSSQVIFMTFGSIVVTSIVNPLFLFPIGVLTAIFFFIQKYYLKTSKNIKRLEGITRSPAFVHLGASIQGLSTIRAFNAQEILIKEFDQHQNLHTGAWFMFLNIAQAFGFALDVLCTVFFACVTFSFLLTDSKSINGASVGLAISQVIFLAVTLQWGVRQSAEVMNQLMAVERVLEYRDLESEEKGAKKTADKNWPENGKVKFNNVVYRYDKSMEPALKGVNFEVDSCQKIGIVGRTGAGKSSLIGSLFRIAEVEGEIIIDGVETSTITLEQLRSKISIIPQDPVLFSGTMRKNLDPFDDYSDDLLWKALEEVKLKDIPALNTQGLQTLVAAGGSNFSVGQRQLICLARAILRNNKVLVLDEATANVDPETDGLIQETIREKFKDCTVMTIAHRLHTVMDSDKILVMNFGKVEEFNTPLKLLEIKGGIFAGMVKATGPLESKNLIELAKKKINVLN